MTSAMYQVACALTPVATNSLLPNGQIKIDTHSTFKSSSITFSLNKPFRVTLSERYRIENVSSAP